jgi:hypothetical protein
MSTATHRRAWPAKPRVLPKVAAPSRKRLAPVRVVMDLSFPRTRGMRRLMLVRVMDGTRYWQYYL